MPALPGAGRHDLADDQWRVLESLLPREKKAGRPPTWTRPQLIDGIRWRTRAGAPWRDVPPAYGPWQSVYGLFRRWQRDGTWRTIVTALQALADAAGHVTWTSRWTRAPRGRTSTRPGPGRTAPRSRSRPAGRAPPSPLITAWAGPGAG